MACSRGKANPDMNTKLRLFSESGGFCQNPSCNRSIFASVDGESIHFGEMAHIFSAIDGGPRTNEDLTEEKRGSFENLIILCPTCHTIIDKREDSFPDSLLSGWKSNHRDAIMRALHICKLATSDEFKQTISQLLAENEFIHRRFGPDNDYRMNPESEEAGYWTRKIRSQIIPNNRKILMLFEANKIHFDTQDSDLIQEFRQHNDDLERKHIFGEQITSIRFPEGMNKFKVNNA